MTKMRLITYNKKPINSPENEIIFYNSLFLFHQPVTLYLEQLLEEPKTSKYDYIITDPNGIEYFKCVKNEKRKIVIYDINNNPLVNIHFKTFPFNVLIYGGDDDKNLIATYYPKRTKNDEKFKFEYNNLANGKKEFIDMNCDKNYCSCGIFYGSEEENAPLICKFVELMDSNSFMTYCNKKYVIEIAANVDNTLLISLAIFFAEMNLETRKNRENFSGLTR